MRFFHSMILLFVFHCLKQCPYTFISLLSLFYHLGKISTRPMTNSRSRRRSYFTWSDCLNKLSSARLMLLFGNAAFSDKQPQNMLCSLGDNAGSALFFKLSLPGQVKKGGRVIVLLCPFVVGTRVWPMVPRSVGRKMSRRARLWMSLLQDPWARLQQSVAWNGSAIVGEKGNSTLADTQKQTAAPSDHSLPDRFWSWQGPHTGHCLGRKEEENGFVWLLLLSVRIHFIFWRR